MCDGCPIWGEPGDDGRPGADGIVTLVHVDSFTGPGDEELFSSQAYRVRLDGWSALMLRIWAEHLEAEAVFDRLEAHWAPWMPPDPFLEPQFPRYWTLPDYHLGGNEAGRRGIDLSKWAR